MRIFTTENSKLFTLSEFGEVSFLVPQVGLEPTRISPLASKTSVATITPPRQRWKEKELIHFQVLRVEGSSFIAIKNIIYHKPY